MLAATVATTAKVASFNLIVFGSVVRWPGRGPGRPANRDGFDKQYLFMKISYTVKKISCQEYLLS
jgi:hypothetical protein